MTDNKKQEDVLLGILDANLIPAVVPVHISSHSPHVISEQPYSTVTVPDNGTAEGKRSVQHVSRRSQQQVKIPKGKSPEGLSRLLTAEEVLITLEQSWIPCVNSGTQYFVSDPSKGDSEESQIFQGSEGESVFCFGSVGTLRNVVIRDRENLPIARVCFKEKQLLLDSLVLAVYCPPQTLIATVEQSPTCFVLSKEFMLGNQNGDHEFRISYEGGICTSQFYVTALQNQHDTNPQAAHILEKTSKSIRVKFVSKMSINSKLILVGFCIGAIHKRMPQDFRGPMS